jgi:hypothetical protein
MNKPVLVLALIGVLSASFIAWSFSGSAQVSILDSEVVEGNGAPENGGVLVTSAARLERVLVRDGGVDSDSGGTGGECVILVSPRIDGEDRPLMQSAYLGKAPKTLAIADASGRIELGPAMRGAHVAIRLRGFAPAFLTTPSEDGTYRLALARGENLAVQVEKRGVVVEGAWVKLATGSTPSRWQKGADQLLPLESGGCAVWQQTGPNGYAEFDSLLPARYWIDVVADGAVIAETLDPVDVSSTGAVTIPLEDVWGIALNLGEPPLNIRIQSNDFKPSIKALALHRREDVLPKADYVMLGTLRAGSFKTEVEVAYVGSRSGVRKRVAAQLMRVSKLVPGRPRVITEEQGDLPGRVVLRVMHGDEELDGVRISAKGDSPRRQFIISGRERVLLPGRYTMSRLIGDGVELEFDTPTFEVAPGTVASVVARVKRGFLPIKLVIPSAEVDRYGFVVDLRCGMYAVSKTYGRLGWITLPSGKDVDVSLKRGGVVAGERILKWSVWQDAVGDSLSVDL